MIRSQVPEPEQAWLSEAMFIRLAGRRRRSEQLVPTGRRPTAHLQILVRRLGYKVAPTSAHTAGPVAEAVGVVHTAAFGELTG